MTVGGGPKAYGDQMESCFIENFSLISASYQEHIKSKHELVTPFKCDLCSRSFGTRTRYKTHKINVHSRVR